VTTGWLRRASGCAGVRPRGASSRAWCGMAWAWIPLSPHHSIAGCGLRFVEAQFARRYAEGARIKPCAVQPGGWRRGKDSLEEVDCHPKCCSVRAPWPAAVPHFRYTSPAGAKAGCGRKWGSLAVALGGA
jgi:hypothetical protein